MLESGNILYWNTADCFFIFSVKKHKHGCQLVTVALRTNELSQLNNKNTQDLHKDWHLGKIKLWNVLRSLFYEFVSPDETECIYSEQLFKNI